jgi:hypothetical protein
MTAGLPGTGIGGIFYLLLALLAPVREVPRLLRGQSSLRRWRTITGQLAIVAGIAGAMALEMWGLNSLITRAQHAGYLPPDAEKHVASSTTALWAAGASLATLTFVFLVVHTLRLLVKKRAGVISVPLSPPCPLPAAPHASATA